MHKKTLLVVGITILFLGTCITPSVAIDNVKKSSALISNGNILYVGGSGEGNFTKIQYAIDNASNGDTVFVYNESSPYYEHIRVDKSINLIGEDKDTTVVGGDGLYVSVKNSNNVNIQSFTFIGGGESGVHIVFDYCSNCTFYDNIVQGDYLARGVGIYYSSEIKILKNYIISNWSSIEIDNSQNCIIENNYVGGYEKLSIMSEGISVDYSTNITIIHNHISRCIYGIGIIDSENITVIQNYISRCVWGIIIVLPENVNIIQNNFIRNIIYTTFSSNLKNLFCIYWDGNYWGRPRLLPHPIRGRLYLIPIPIVQFDWHPAKEPYDIGA